MFIYTLIYLISINKLKRFKEYINNNYDWNNYLFNYNYI